MAAKVKVVTRTQEDEGIAEMFNQMLGAGKININICYPKYVTCKQYIKSILDIINMFANSRFVKSRSELTQCSEDIQKFVESARKDYADIYSVDLKDFEWNLNLVDEASKETFSKKYEQMKNDTTLHIFIKMCDNLIKYRKHLKDDKNIDHRFIVSMSGLEFCPFPFSNINFKLLINDLLSESELAGRPISKFPNKEIEFCMIVLHKMLTLSHGLYVAYSKPDIDVNEFVEVIMNNIKEVKKQVPRCDKAFKKIIDSVTLLKTNFNDYYKDFIQTQNQMVIMENFINDVAKNTTADPETTRQFRAIITYYKKIASTQIKNPKMKMLFERVSANLSELERNENIVSVKDLDAEDDDDRAARLAAEAEEAARAAKEKAAADAVRSQQQQAYDKLSTEEIMRMNGL